MGASSNHLWTLTPPCFTLRAAGTGGSFFWVAPGCPGACDYPLAVKRCKLGLGLHPRQRRDRSLFRAILPTRRAMSPPKISMTFKTRGGNGVLREVYCFLCERVGSCKLVGDGLWWGVGVGGRRAATPVRSSFFILLA